MENRKQKRRTGKAAALRPASTDDRVAHLISHYAKKKPKQCIDAAKKRGFDEIHTMLLETRERTEAHAKSQPSHQIDETLKAPLTEGDVAAVKRLLAEKPELTAASRDNQTSCVEYAHPTRSQKKACTEI